MPCFKALIREICNPMTISSYGRLSAAYTRVDT